MTDKLKILFLCTGNSCRSQMAEGWARQLRSDCIDAYSAAIETHGLNPLAVKVMAQAGVDISAQHSKNVAEVLDVPFDYIITVCSNANETCPIFPGRAKVIHVGFDDPPKLANDARTEDEALAPYRRVRDEIKAFVMTLPESLASQEPGQATMEQSPLYILNNPDWGLRMTLEAPCEIPPGAPITGVVVVATHKGKWLLVDTAGRGISPLAGRTETSESPEQTARREAMEESGAELERLWPVGRIKVEHTDARQSKYPKLAFLSVFAAEVSQIGPIPSGSESRGIVWATENELAELFASDQTTGQWHLAICRHAIRQYKTIPADRRQHV